jgi:acyl-homoserine lactone acylase PvdQ
LIADDLLPELAGAVASIGTDPKLMPYRNRPELPQLFTRLLTWDHQMSRDSAEAVIFFALANFATQRALGDDLGAMLIPVMQADPGFAFKMLRLALRGVQGAQGLLQEGKNVILVGGLADTADWLKTRFGTYLPTTEKPYAWKDVHGAEFSHVLGGKWSGGVVPVDGSVGTVNVSSSTLLDGSGKPRDSVTARAGSLYRMITSFDDTGTPTALVNFTRGNDENPQSQFYNNQQPGWVDNQGTPLLFKRADVEQHTAQKFTLRRDGSVQD